MQTIIRVEGVLPMAGEPVRRRAALIIEDERILDVLSWEDAGLAYPQATVVTYEGAWALPGFIDAHVHLCFSGGVDALHDILVEKDDEALLTLRMVQNCQAALSAGVTTLRDCGAGGNAVYRLREAVREGRVVGSHIIACGQPFTITGGHCWFLNREVEGVEDVRRCARQSMKDGAEFLKMMISGGHMTPGSGGTVLQYTPEEVRAMVYEANMRGKMTAAHVHSTESIRIAVHAGISTLEHMSFIGSNGGIEYDPAVVDVMAANGQIFSPAFCACYYFPLDDQPPEKQAEWRRFREGRMDVSRRILGQGVRMALSSDAGCDMTLFCNFAEMMLMAHEQLRLSPMDILTAVTRNAAECCGIQDRAGTLEKGKRADITLLARDPLVDLTATREVRAVYKSGKLSVENGRIIL